MLNIDEIDFEDYTLPHVVEVFMERMKEWIELKDVEQTKKNKEVSYYLNLTKAQISDMTKEDAISGSYILFGYAYYVQSIINREQAVLDWASDSLWYIVADKMNNYGGENSGYLKWEQKYYAAIKENVLAREIMKLKTHCLSRVNLLKESVGKIEKMGTMLEQIARGK